jgi:anthranilate synthase component 2
MRALLLDCRDSFVWNLAQLAGRLLRPGDSLDVVRCGRLRLSEAAKYDKIILSPGPGVPEEAPNLMELIDRRAHSTPFLGVCLGHQALALAFGGRLANLPEVFHGVKSRIRIMSPEGVFRGFPEEIQGGRYHSWAVSDEGFPDALAVTARDEGGLIMAFAHKTLDVTGVQFHPESILTPMGPKMLENFLYGEGRAWARSA